MQQPTHEHSQPTASTDRSSSFEENLFTLAMHAAARASRAREFSLEWQALGYALAGAHLLFVVLPRATLTFVDVVVLVLTIGGGILMSVFELRSRSDLLQLSKRLQEEAHVTTGNQSSGAR